MQKKKGGCRGSIIQPLGEVGGDSKEINKEGILMLGLNLGSECHVD